MVAIYHLLFEINSATSKQDIALVVTVVSLTNPDSKVHGANMGPTWVLSAPDGPHVGPMNLAIWEGSVMQKAFHCHGARRWISLMKGQWYRALMFPLMLAWTSCWTNCSVVGDLGSHASCVASQLFTFRAHTEIGAFSIYHHIAKRIRFPEHKWKFVDPQSSAMMNQYITLIDWIDNYM